MRIKFLVLLAVTCLSVHFASAHKSSEKAAAKPEKAAHPEKNVHVEKHIHIHSEKHHHAHSEKHHTAPQVVEVEEEVIVKHNKHTEVKKHSKEKKTHIEVKKVIHKKDVEISCAEATKKDKIDCETKDVPAGYKGVFTFKEDADCDWECNYEALPKPPAPKKEEKKKVVVIKKKEHVEKPVPKECSGEKKIKFSNCKVKLRGLIAWGDKTKNFDKKFERLLHKKAKKGAKKAKKGAKKAPKTDKKKANPPKK